MLLAYLYDRRGGARLQMSTVQERRIIRDLSAIYLLFGVVTGGWSWGSTMNLDWGNVPQWITAVIAVCATAVAAIGINGSVAPGA
jgi:hypothetical protein